VHPTDRTAGHASERVTDTGRLDRTISGIVELGDQRGRTIGFPTANIRLGLRHVDVADGVYASIAQLADGRRLAAATSVGRRPTFYLEGERLCEVHLIDFAEDIYSTRLRVRLIAFLRGQQRFDSIDDLRQQLRDDVDVSARACADHFAIESTPPHGLA
jgi:riboflavin kinase/FMN adenylyltransferase